MFVKQRNKNPGRQLARIDSESLHADRRITTNERRLGKAVGVGEVFVHLKQSLLRLLTKRSESNELPCGS